jgi:hypothetical protein
MGAGPVAGRGEMSRRNTADPLVRAFLDTYKVNLLSVPRENAEVGDAYVEMANGSVSAPGKLRHLLTPEIRMPDILPDELMATIRGKQTRALDLSAGINLLEGFFSAIGADAAVGKIKAEYQRKRVGKLRFQLKNATRDAVDAFEFGKALIPCQLNGQQPFVQDGNRYYAVIGVLRSRSITVSTEDERANKIEVAADALKSAIAIDGKFGITRENSGDITYEGAVPLAFGVELVELLYNREQKKFLLSGITDPKVVRRVGDDKERRVFVGDPDGGNVFIDLK